MPMHPLLPQPECKVLGATLTNGTAVRDLRVNTSAPELSGPAATGGDIEPDLASLLEHLAQLAGAAAAPLLPALEEQALGGKLRNWTNQQVPNWLKHETTRANCSAPAA